MKKDEKMNKTISKEEAMLRIYKKAYAIIGELTPVTTDCGKLCDKRCCKGDDETGMYLFPFEELMMKNTEKWLNISKSDFNYTFDRYAPIAVCHQPCPRNRRPFSCRIFPLVPYVDKEGRFSVIMDKRAKSICPLAFALDINDLDKSFTEAVHKACSYLMNYRMISKFIKAQSRLIDEFDIFF